jgi:hypothetical protein
MTQPDDTSPPQDPPAGDAREPEASPQRRLLEQIEAYEVDPPAPSRAREGHPDT